MPRPAFLTTPLDKKCHRLPLPVELRTPSASRHKDNTLCETLSFCKASLSSTLAQSPPAKLATLYSVFHRRAKELVLRAARFHRRSIQSPNTPYRFSCRAKSKTRQVPR